MEVREEKVLDDGAYAAECSDVVVKDTTFGERLMWTYYVPEEDAQVVGFTSMSPSTRGNAYQWAAALMGSIDPKIGWGPEDVIGKKCRILLETTEDTNGATRNKVVKVMPPGAQAKTEELNEKDFDDLPF